MMYAVVKDKAGPGLVIKEVDEPRPGRNDVLVKIVRAAICGTDIHIWKWNEWAESRIKNIPLIIGHEFSGYVVDVGVDVTGVDVGALVSGETHIVDRTCYQCRTGKMHICRNLKIIGVDRDGAFAEYIVIPAMNAWVNDKSLNPDIAAVLEPLGNAVNAVFPSDCVSSPSGKYALVLGCGPIGLMSIAVLKEAGVEKLFAVEISDYRLTFAEMMGADILINPLEEDVIKTVLDETRGRGVDIVLEMSGAESAIKTGFKLVTPGGRVSLLGLPDKPVSIDLNTNIIFRGAAVYGITGRRIYQTWYQVRGLLNIPSFRDKIGTLITHRIDMGDVEDGLKLLETKEAVKIVMEPKFT